MAALNEKLLSAQNEIKSLMEKNLYTVETYRKINKELETKYNTAQSQVDLLKENTNKDVNENTMKQMKELQKSILTELADMKSKAVSNSSSTANMNEMHELRYKNEKMNNELTELRRGGGNSEAMARLEQENKTLRDAVASGKGGGPLFPPLGGSGAAGALTQRENIELKSRVSTLDEELSKYKEYMKSNMVRYQQEIVRLKEEVEKWKREAVNRGAIA